MTQNVERTRPDPLATSAVEQTSHRGYRDVRVDSRRKTGWWQSVWLVPVVAGVIVFLIKTLPPFLTFDPAKQQSPLNPSAPGLNYAVLVAHVLFGTVALVTVCLQVWPWLRTRHPAVHRWSGRVYVFLGALPTAVLALVVNYLHNGWHGNIGAYAQGGMLFITTMIGYVAIRHHNYLKHRRWMLYSFAMSTSIVWGLIVADGQALLAPKADFSYVIELSRWGSWLLNLLIVKWWLDRTDRRATAIRVPA
jgi:uncharacterized membrane protein YozB (DUF420 family)